MGEWKPIDPREMKLRSGLRTVHCSGGPLDGATIQAEGCFYFDVTFGRLGSAKDVSYRYTFEWPEGWRSIKPSDVEEWRATCVDYFEPEEEITGDLPDR